MSHAWVACFLDLPPPPPFYVLSLARYAAALLRMHHGAILSRIVAVNDSEKPDSELGSWVG
jgi:hypothetical protein